MNFIRKNVLWILIMEILGEKKIPNSIQRCTAAKSLQSCPTLSDPMDCSLPGSSAQGIFQARVLEWGAIAFSSKVYNVK